MKKFGVGSLGGKSADMGGKPMPKKDKVATVMREFRSGKLKSSSGQKVTNPKQAIAIGLSEAGMSKPKMREDGQMAESKAMMKKEVSFMKKKGAPKSMVKHEEAEMKDMKKGGKAYASGGHVYRSAADGIAKKGRTRVTEVKMKRGGKAC